MSQMKLILLFGAWQLTRVAIATDCCCRNETDSELSSTEAE